ncbi:inward rectifier potassium channel 16 [Microcaecilia unicolor]|uniref:Inward rectifier potassium channel 16 n=1 Tax=Microcaecilia unicolor TaxID=1415580 RepID=A0A6P7YMX9_9AMPH|nr:inward rectifier potassium channel 16 [Microcaecilia unicolor]XP_030064369.1 inward rectifier potassium channel 16 [Microcaecilia unicolor]XP_030064371.1 inward rectifier potassium channel 16 [Microcaecilia unicolor]XP_030064372.1 inward rectifier potassium channel 16 [Microcaecilia unicolor]XP_030064373.1 inward rectifier potassium channel 16 [Microcaecilia unicolor]XP_030064374.1 inward rectifier potassium channel 16 [Microcaecilia unicolor]XP_030064375.1 inward rectifier potassium chann
MHQSSSSHGPRNVKENSNWTQKRFLQKDGSCNVYFKHIFGEWESYVVDIFTTLVDIKWRHMFIIFSLSYILSWLLFGLLFWIIALQHGDLIDLEKTPCIDKVHSFTGAFLFSLETQTTIGYGYRCVTEECSLAIITVTLQSVLSCFIDTFIIGAALAKMAKARKRAQTIRFSDFAIVGIRDGKLCLMWRIGDFRPNHMVEGAVRAQLLRYKNDTEKRITMEFKDLKLVNEQIILVTPVTVVHVINRESPLYELDRKALAVQNFEILVTFVYTGDSTGTSHQSRSSYLPQEIMWGFRFNNVLQVKKKYYKVYCTEFEEVTEFYTPFCSAKQLDFNEQTYDEAETPLDQQVGNSVSHAEARSNNTIITATNTEDPENTTAVSNQTVHYHQDLVSRSRRSTELQA